MNEIKTPPIPDKATPRPWFAEGKLILSDDMKIADVCISNALHFKEMEANAALIVKSVNESDLLNRVAEAAELHQRADSSKSVRATRIFVAQTLAALKQFRAEGGK